MSSHVRFLILLMPLFPAAPAAALELDEFLRTVVQTNPGVQRILSQTDIAEGRLLASQGVDDPRLSSSASLLHTEPDAVTGFEADHLNRLGLDLGLERTYSQTGTRIGLRYADGFTSQNPSAAAAGATYYQPSVTLRITRPLLKNADGIQDRLNTDLSRLDLDLAEVQAHEELESYLTRLAALYLDWFLSWRESRILEDMHARAGEQEKLVSLKVRREVAEPYELLRAQELRQDYYARWQQTLGTLAGLERQVASQMRQTTMQLTPVDPQTVRLLRPIEDASNDYLATESRLHTLLDTLRRQQEVLLDARSDARKGDLDLSFAYTRHGAHGDALSAHHSALDRNDASVMLEYSVPLGNRRAEGDYSAQLASRRQVRADTEQRLLDAQAALADLQARALKLQQAIDALDDKIGLGKRKLREERRLYDIGELDLFELLQDQTAHLETRLNRERLQIQLFKLRLSIGELLDRNLEPYLNAG